MSITSYPFIAFVLLLLLCYYLIFAKRGQWVCLLAASLLFYAFSGPKNLAFLLLTALTCYLGGRKLYTYEQTYAVFRKDKSHSREERTAKKEQIQKKKRVVLTSVLVLNFGILALVKCWGVAYHGLLLPLGISFYTFQSVSYLIDCYNGKYPPERNFLKYLLFVSFFPQLIQGPIGRFDQLSSQLTAQRKFDLENFKRSLLLTSFGILKKYAIANILSGPISVLLDDHAAELPGSAVVFAILMYSAQQYADFSGGIDIVTGVAGMFGVQLAPNFRQPYFSVSLADFWRRWHISLGAWMRDYVFYPFALLKPIRNLGKKISKKWGKHLGVVLPASIANILVFFLVGIWHGAEMHYVLWGLYNGIVIALSDILSPVFHRWNEVLRINEKSFGMKVFRILRTFLIVNIGWYFDRIYDFQTGMSCFGKTVSAFHLGALPAILSEFLADSMDARKLFIVAAGLVIVFWVSLQRERGRNVYADLQTWPIVPRWCAYYSMILLIQFACDYVNSSAAFMYAYF